MSNKLTIIIIMVLILIAGLVIGAYFIIDLQKEDNTQKNVIINFKVLSGEEEIKADINIYNNRSFLSAKNFNKAWESFKVQNGTFLNVLTNSSGYYSSLISFNASTTNKEITLEPIGDIIIDHSGDFEEGIKIINLNINSTGKVKLIYLCLKESSGFYYAVIEGKGETEKPERLSSKARRCYSLNTTLDNSHITIPIKTKAWSITSTQNIKVWVLDSDLIFKNNEFNYSTEDLEGNNIGKEDWEYLII